MQIADIPPALAVIVQVPGPLDVTFPLDTCATFSLLVVQMTVLFVAFSGVTDAVAVLFHLVLQNSAEQHLT